MKKVTLYTKSYCPYCDNAKRLLKSKNVPYEEISVEGKEEEYTKLKERTGMRTVPQIFIGDELVGGFTELLALEKSGKLDAKLE